MKSKAIKTILYWVASFAVMLIGIPVTAWVIYLFLDTAGLHGLGQMLIFQIGLALVECGSFIWAASKLSETVLHDEKDLELERLDIFEDLD